VTCAGRLAFRAGVFGVVLMAGSFGGTRSADRLRRLSRVSALNLHSQPKTSNIFLENMIWFFLTELVTGPVMLTRFSRHGTASGNRASCTGVLTNGEVAAAAIHLAGASKITPPVIDEDRP